MTSLTKRACMAAAILAALALSACASGTTTVVAPAQITQGSAYPTAKIEAGTDTVTVPPEARTHFDKRLNEYLYAKDSGFTQGDALIVRYRFIQFDEGSRALRYLLGFGAGKGTMTVEVVFLDKSQRELAKINVGGEISMGVFGGDFDEAISRAAKEVATYAINTF